MSRRTTWLIIAAMFAIGTVVRVNNAMVFSPVRAYDGFAHFSYIWFLAENWRIPLPTSAWQFFQPPLYYAWMAWLWDVLDPMDPLLRLKIGTLVMALLGLVHAGASFLLVRRVLPQNRLAQVAAAGLMLFLPVNLYSAGFIGNEYLCAVLCTVSLLALMQVLDRPTPLRAAWLGLWLGAAMLTKFSAIVVVAAAFATLGARAVVRREWAVGLRSGAVAAAVMLVLCGWFYGRNVVLYGTPFKMSRETFVLQRYENVQTRGRRTIWEYVLFDPVILRRPQWPRGVPLVEEIPIQRPYSAARESVLTGLYANTWFDGYGGWVLPSVLYSDVVRHCGQVLLTLGLVPTGLVVAGFLVAIRRLWKEGWDDTLAAMVASSAAMVALVVQGTSSVPVHAAVKATYLLPIAAVFGFWLGLGIDWVQRRHPRGLKGVVACCAVLAAFSTFVFFQGRTVAPDWFDEAELSPLWRNIYGVISYAGGDDDSARRYFESAARDDYHLGLENLAIMTADEEPLRAVHYMRRALQVQPSQSLGTPWDRARFNANTAAEYQNTMAVFYHRLGWSEAAREAALRATHNDPLLPEARYDLALLMADLAVSEAGSTNEPARRTWMARSRKLAFDTLLLDSAFHEAFALSATLEAIDGRCDEAEAMLQQSRQDDAPRLYPVDTGIGDMLASSIKRRRHITDIPERLTPEFQIARCRAGKQAHGS